MIKQGLKNYLGSLKYFFTPLGTLALGVLFGLSFFIPHMMTAFNEFMGEIRRILANPEIDITVLKTGIVEAVRALDWSDPGEALRTMLTSGWMLETLNACAGAFVGEVEQYARQFTAAIDVLCRRLISYAVVFAVFTAIGVAAGHYLTKWLIRRRIARRSAWKVVMGTVADGIFAVVDMFFVLWLMLLWKDSVYITTVISILLAGMLTLFEAYLIHARKKTNRKSIVNGKNILSLTAVNLIIYFLSMAVVIVLTVLTNTIVGVAVGMVLLDIALIVIGLNAESYVISVVGNVGLSAPAEGAPPVEEETTETDETPADTKE